MYKIHQERFLLDKLAIAARYCVSVRTVENWMRRRILPHVKIGRLIRFDVAACDKAVKAFEIKSAVALNEGGQGHAE